LTRYRLDGPGIEFRSGEIFLTCPDQPRGIASLLKVDTGSFQGVKRPERGVVHPSPSSAEVKERLELYLYSPMGLRGELYLYLYLKKAIN
jgi:hypothetical protein